MEELILYIAKSLVSKPEDVKIKDCGDRGDFHSYEVSVNPEETGKVIGKQGRIAKSFRSVVKAAAMKNGQKIVIEIV